MPCAYCKNQANAETLLHLPDGRDYCVRCCDAMAADAFGMETGEKFSAWIAKHPKLTMRYQPMEVKARQVAFVFPAACVVGGLAALAFGLVKLAQNGVGSGRPLGFVAVGFLSMILFGWLALRGVVAWLRAQDFELTLEDGTFELRHGSRRERFSMQELTQACVVRPGTVGATEGALGFADGRMLTLDTCLSDLHALGVVMDLHFAREFPPSLEDLAQVRREKLRKIRGLS